jgi:hypothetical protein
VTIKKAAPWIIRKSSRRFIVVYCWCWIWKTNPIRSDRIRHGPIRNLSINVLVNVFFR